MNRSAVLTGFMSSVTPISTSGSESFINPQSLVEGFDLEEGMRAADFGAGSGYFTLHLAQKVGTSGQVAALDILESALSTVRSQAVARGLKNIQTIRADLEVLGGSGLADRSQNLVLLANILFQSSQKMNIVREAKRVLVGGGRLVVIDWQESANGLGPPPELRIKKEELKKQVAAEGFGLEQELEAGQFHFGLIFKKL